MALPPPLGEPEAGPCRTEPLSTVIEALTGPARWVRTDDIAWAHSRFGWLSLTGAR